MFLKTSKLKKDKAEFLPNSAWYSRLENQCLNEK
jgi:hypothetical protein